MFWHARITRSLSLPSRMQPLAAMPLCFIRRRCLSMDRQAKRVWDSGRAFAYGFRDRCLSRSYADPASRQAGDADIDTQKQKKRNRFHTSSSYCTGNTICMSGFTETSCVTDCCFVPYAARNCIFTGRNSLVMMPLVATLRMRLL